MLVNRQAKAFSTQAFFHITNNLDMNIIVKSAFYNSCLLASHESTDWLATQTLMSEQRGLPSSPRKTIYQDYTNCIAMMTSLLGLVYQKLRECLIRLCSQVTHTYTTQKRNNSLSPPHPGNPENHAKEHPILAYVSETLQAIQEHGPVTQLPEGLQTMRDHTSFSCCLHTRHEKII